MQKMQKNKKRKTLKISWLDLNNIGVYTVTPRKKEAVVKKWQDSQKLKNDY